MSTNGEAVEEDHAQTETEDETTTSYEETNGHAPSNKTSSPIPPPHKVPSPPPKPAIDPEACKALGNKYFKAKDYTKAIAEYTKGKSPNQVMTSTTHGEMRN